MNARDRERISTACETIERVASQFVVGRIPHPTVLDDQIAAAVHELVECGPEGPLGDHLIEIAEQVDSILEQFLAGVVCRHRAAAAMSFRVAMVRDVLDGLPPVTSRQIPPPREIRRARARRLAVIRTIDGVAVDIHAGDPQSLFDLLDRYEGGGSGGAR